MAIKGLTKQASLQRVPLFSGLKKSSLNEVAKIADEIEIPAGRVIFKEGGIAGEFVLILAGKAAVAKHGNIINHLAPDDFFGEIALIDGRPRTASVIAETDMKLLVVESRYFQDLCAKTPDLLNRMLIALCKYIRYEY